MPGRLMSVVTIMDKRFELFIPHEKIIDAVGKIADSINKELANKDVLFLGILNGAFMFASDLIRRIQFNCTISFLKLASYTGTSSTNEIKSLIGLNEDIRGKTVVIIEDIIDSGHTIENLLIQLGIHKPDEIKVAALLVKPMNVSKDIKIDYKGFEIPGDFIVGYGLDYNGYGRNLKDIYKLI